MKTFKGIGNKLEAGLSYSEYTRNLEDSIISSWPIGQVFEKTLKPITPAKSKKQLGGIHGVWIPITVDHLLEHGVTIPITIGETILEAIPNKHNVKDMFYTAAGYLGDMDLVETSVFMNSILDFVGLNSDFFHGLVLPELDPNWRNLTEAQ